MKKCEEKGMKNNFYQKQFWLMTDYIIKYIQTNLYEKPMVQSEDISKSLFNAKSLDSTPKVIMILLQYTPDK